MKFTLGIREFVIRTFMRGKVCLVSSQLIVGDWPLDTKPNLVGGHEGAGIAAAVGENVQDVKVGDHVGIKVVSPFGISNSSGSMDLVEHVSIV
jgi:D-arabinose 1-dehydrogenase-like Zn-dependent alcohol dehydrogenase